ncbi:MAG: FtsX-like permease family protein [Phycisphaerae bacterium]
MNKTTLILRGLAYHRRTYLAVMLGVAAATTTLTGALLVGDSMRGSLRAGALGRLGRIDDALIAPRFFRASLAVDIASSPAALPTADTPPLQDPASKAGPDTHSLDLVPAILLRGTAVHAGSRARVSRIQVLGVTEAFWALGDVSADAADAHRPARDTPQDTAGHARAHGVGAARSVTLNDRLAAELGAAVGDDVLLRVERSGSIPTETLLGRADNTSVTLRLTVAAVVPSAGIGGFAPTPQPYPARNAFVPLAVLQRALGQRGRVNAMLASTRDHRDGDPPRGNTAGADRTQRLNRRLRDHIRLADYGLKLRRDNAYGYIALESDRVLIEPAAESAARAAARAMDLQAVPVLTYLANRIDIKPPTPTHHAPSPTPRAAPAIPYATVAAIDVAPTPAGGLRLIDDTPAPLLGPRDVLLNTWAADDLGANPGDIVRMSYYVTGPLGRLDTEHAEFVVTGVVPLTGMAGDPRLTPAYPGITDAKHMGDWDPPFPVDFTRIRDKDERYWDDHGATPKAFISLATGVRLWAHDGARFGRLTSIRLVPHAGAAPNDIIDPFRRNLLDRLRPASFGIAFDPIRDQAMSAANGTTDFGMLFIGFSSFLIMSAAMLVALLFRLSTERRSPELGMLLAIGLAPPVVSRLLILEGAVVAGAGGVLGVVGAVGYAWAMLAGLGSWWSAAVTGPVLSLHMTLTSLGIGYAAGFVVALCSIAWSIRGLTRISCRALLTGAMHAHRTAASGAGRPRRWAGGVTCAGLLAAVGLVGAGAAGVIPATGAFFGGGAAMLVACLGGLSRWLRHAPRRAIGVDPRRDRGGTAPALIRLAIRHATRNPGRSLLTASLIAAASFVIIAVGANRKTVAFHATDRHTGTGGFTLLARSAIPLHHDLNTPTGRTALNLSRETHDALTNVRVVPWRVRSGAETSCLNLYRPSQPRIIGATGAMIHRGGFAFASSLATSNADRDNPWRLLQQPLADGAIPAIGDVNAVMWQLHLGLGRDLIIKDEHGDDVRLRFVALLADSVLQSEVVIAESAMLKLFPSISGYAFFLLETPDNAAQRVATVLERELADYGFDATHTVTRLAEYHAVENTYLATFQMLGGLGLVLGTFGLGAVLARNVFERRRELAMMRALGFRTGLLASLVLIEHGALLLAGLLAGTLSALVAVAPHLRTSGNGAPWVSLGGTLVLVLIVGAAAAGLALIPMLRTPLVPALRRE